MKRPPPSDDRAWCHAALPRVSRTFALNIRVLDGPLREAVTTGYLLCRAADALEDSWPGPAAEVGERFDLLLGALEGDDAACASLARAARAVADGRSDLELLAELPRVWRVWRGLPAGDGAILAEGVRVLATGMRRYATRAAVRPAEAPYLDTEDELHDYCWVVAGCVGVMLTRLFGGRRPAAGAQGADRERRRLELAPIVGEALQLTNILLDWPADVRRGRCYMPAAWLAEHGLTPRDLVGRAHPGALEIARRLEALARAALARVPAYLETLPREALRYRLFVVWPALWALASLECARSDPAFPWGERRPRLSRLRLSWEAARGLVDPGGGVLRAAAG